MNKSNPTSTIERKLSANLYSRFFFLLLFFLQHVLISRSLGAALTGELYYTTSIFQLTMLIVSLNADAGIGYLSASGKQDRHVLFSLTIIVTLAVCFVLPILWKVFSGFYKTQNEILNQRILLFMICNVGGMILINFFQRLFNAENAFALPNYVLSITSLIFIFCTLVYKGAVEHILVAYFLLFPLQGVSLLSIYFLRYRSQKSFVFPALKQWKSLFEYSLKALSANLVFFLVMRFDYWVVKTNCSDIQTGNYLQAARLGQMLMIVPQIMAAVILPAASRDSNNIKEVIARLVRIMFHIYILVFICIFLFGDLLVLKLFGSSFAGMNAVLLYSIPGFFFLSSLSLYAAWFAGQNKVTVNLRGAVYAFVFILTADLFFIPRYGIKAAAMISSIGYGINLLYAVIKYRNEFQKFPRLYDKADYRWLLQILSIR